MNGSNGSIKGRGGAARPGKIRSHRDLEVYRRAFELSMRIFEATKTFPIEERYSLTSQLRRACRSVTGNISEAWRKRRYEAAFVAKVNDAEAEAAETQVWIEHAVRCGYMKRAEAADLYREYERLLGTLVGMIVHADTWIITKVSEPTARKHA